MLRNHLKIAWRNLTRNRAFTFLNISGLAVGMAAAILIGLWAWNEWTFDQYHTNNKTLYKLFFRSTQPGEKYVWDVTPGLYAAELKKDFPAVKKAARVYWISERLFSFNDKSLKAKGHDVDPDFLSMFTFPMLQGNASTALNDMHNIVITEDLAGKLFDGADPMNKTIIVDNKESYKVSGVMKNLPGNTQFDFSYLVPLQKNFWGIDDWSTGNFNTYVQLNDDASIADIQQKIRNMPEQYSPGIKEDVFLYPFSRMHLYSRFSNGLPVGGQIDVLRLVLIIAGLILLIACINFMNLRTAQSQKRAREVGVRKVIGARRRSLVLQFLSESVLIAVISGILALVIVSFALPAFNHFLGTSLSLSLTSLMPWLAFGLFLLGTGLLAGSYPAFFLSAFKPIAVLKGSVTGIKTAFNPRKLLVVLQFSVAIVLVVATIVVYKQLRYVQQRDTGYRIKQLIDIPIEGDLRINFAVLRNDLIKEGVATALCETSLPVTVDGRTSGGFSWDGSTPADAQITFSEFGITGDFVKTMGLKLIEGRDLDLSAYPGDSASALLNETAVKAMKLKNPVGMLINVEGTKRIVQGVVADFIIGSPFQPVQPMMIIGTKGWLWNIVMRLNPDRPVGKGLAGAQTIFKKYNPAFPFTYSFADQEHDEKLKDEKQTSIMAALFAGLTIFISCLGLFGLAAYLAENRAREIGIRKVLGASVTRIAGNLSREFVVLVGLSTFIATPVGWWMMSNWLENYPYRIGMDWKIFLMAGLAAVAIAMATVGYQSVKAAMVNPVKSLRGE